MQQLDLGKNYFELFDLPISFDIDNRDLAARYRQLQRRVHPDRFADGSDQERRLSMQMTALINEAFHTLKDPLNRGRYLLKLRGVDTGEETDTSMEPEFLMEQMELREALSQVRQDSDPFARLDEVAHRIEERYTMRVRQLGELLADDNGAGNQQARNVVRELQFFDKLRRELEELEEQVA
jgi:molecular chaperone HscB